MSDAYQTANGDVYTMGQTPETHGMGTTTINGVNDKGDPVGFYVDANGNTDGFLATAVHQG